MSGSIFQTPSFRREGILCKWSQTVSSSHTRTKLLQNLQKGDFCREMKNFLTHVFFTKPSLISILYIVCNKTLAFFRQPRVSRRLGKGICESNKQASHQVIKSLSSVFGERKSIPILSIQIKSQNIFKKIHSKKITKSTHITCPMQV